MIGHLFKLIWNRRRANGLILLELLFSFLVLCGVLTITSNYVVNMLRPLGFTYDNVWWVQLGVPQYRLRDSAQSTLLRSQSP